MGVMACGRDHCTNVMCSRLILDGSTYICDDCWNELLEYKKTWSPASMYKADVKANIENFLSSPPGAYIKSTDLNKVIDEEFKRLTEC